MSTNKQPTRSQVLNAANVLERFAKKGMVGYTPTTVQGGKAKPKSKAKPKTASKPKAKPKSKSSKKK